MRKRIGIVCITLGIACLLGAVGFVIHNRWEADAAAENSQSLLADVQISMEENKATDPTQSPGAVRDPAQQQVLPEHSGTPTEMATVKTDGYDCIGILSIPVLELELPVLTDWSYTKLEKAPCLYYGSYYEKDFVIAAHNYEAHFGRLSQLQAGDLVIFTDVNGTARYYEVVLLETLPAEATGEMIASGFDLSLYTCTPGGANRVTARCRLLEANQE